MSGQHLPDLFEATRLHTDSLVVLAPFKVFPCEEKPRNIV